VGTPPGTCRKNHAYRPGEGGTGDGLPSTSDREANRSGLMNGFTASSTPQAAGLASVFMRSVPYRRQRARGPLFHDLELLGHDRGGPLRDGLLADPLMPGACHSPLIRKGWRVEGGGGTINFRQPCSSVLILVSPSTLHPSLRKGGGWHGPAAQAELLDEDRSMNIEELRASLEARNENLPDRAASCDHDRATDGSVA
jgi:hypothetical protein